jgi:(p)ppGpp synthase/HD superfamily hydrolase
MNTELTSRFREALAYAAEVHGAQRRKVSGVPYLGHLLRVAGIVLDHGGTENEAIAALLHDAVEDQGGPQRRDDIARRFGEDVARIVDGCSDTDQHPKPPWRERKEAAIASLATASASVRLVKMADKLDNVRALTMAYREQGPAIWEHFKGGRDGTLWLHRAGLEALKGRDDRPLIGELDRAVAELERLLATSNE